MTVQSMKTDLEGGVVWCKGYMRGEAGCGHGEHSTLDKVNVTDIMKQPMTGSENDPIGNTAQKENMIGQMACL